MYNLRQQSQRPSVNIIISGYYGAVNVGDEAVCRAVVSGMRKVLNCRRVFVVTTNSSKSRTFGGVDEYFLEGFFPTLSFWRHFARYLEAVASSSLVIIGGGGILQDVHSWKSSVRHLVLACFGILFGRPVVGVGIGAGPIRRIWLRKFVSSVCSAMTVLQVRDMHSKRFLSDCGVPPRLINVSADVVLSLQIEDWLESRHTPAALPNRIGFALRRWPGLNKNSLAQLWERLSKEGCEIQLLCYEPESDRQWYEEVLSLCSDKCHKHIFIQIPRTLEEAVRSLGSLDAVIAMRLHACIFSTFLGIPFLAIPYDEKVRNFVEDIGLPERLCQLSDVGPSCADRIREVSRTNLSRTELVSRKLAKMRERSEQNFSIARDSIFQKPSISARLKVIPWLTLLLLIGLVCGAQDGMRVFRRRAAKIGKYLMQGILPER